MRWCWKGQKIIKNKYHGREKEIKQADTFPNPTPSPLLHYKKETDLLSSPLPSPLPLCLPVSQLSTARDSLSHVL